MRSEASKQRRREAQRLRRLLHYDEVMAYQRAWQRNNRDKMKMYDDKWRAANPELAKECDRKKDKKHHKKLQESSPEYRAKNVARVTKWMKENPERSRELRHAISQRHHARKCGSKIGPIDYQQLLIDSCGFCGICNLRLLDNKIDFDHIIPLCRGGTHTQDNLQAAHARCNRRKNSRLMSEITPEELQSMIEINICQTLNPSMQPQTQIQ